MNRFAAAQAVLRQAIAAHVFPGAVFGVWHRGGIFIHAEGTFGYEPGWPAVTPETIYDLASLTKVLATTAVAMRLWQAGKLDLATPVCDLLPQFAGDEPRRALVTLEMLLAHTSGLPAYERFYELPHVDRAAVVQACCATPLAAAPGINSEYSDIGFILLGEALCALTGCSAFDQLCRDTVFQSLGLTATRYLPPAEMRAAIAPTCDWNWRHRVLQGEAQDENCAAMGGVAGHAGVFADCADVLRFAAHLLAPGEFFAPETISKFAHRISGSRALGWDTPSSPSQSGEYFSPRSVGHLGYTGTSLWIDLEQSIAVALLTNRAYTGKAAHPMPRPEAISQVRPRFYKEIMREQLHL